jgi:hypothetical protein
MAVSAFFKVDAFMDEVSKAGHNLQTAVYKVALSNTAPTAASTVWSTGSFPAPAAANGYPSGGGTPTVSSAVTTAGQFKLVLPDFDFIATAGGIGPFRYAILYNSSAANKIVGWYDYGVGLTLAVGEKLTMDFDGTNGVFTIGA